MNTIEVKQFVCFHKVRKFGTMLQWYSNWQQQAIANSLVNRYRNDSSGNEERSMQGITDK